MNSNVKRFNKGVVIRTDIRHNKSLSLFSLSLNSFLSFFLFRSPFESFIYSYSEKDSERHVILFFDRMMAQSFVLLCPFVVERTLRVVSYRMTD